MSTSASFITYIHASLGGDHRVRTRTMFGEYALYYDDRVVALICDDVVYLKITPRTSALLGTDNESGSPYPGAKLHYIIDEKCIQDRTKFAKLLAVCAQDVPVKNKRYNAPYGRTQNKENHSFRGRICLTSNNHAARRYESSHLDHATCHRSAPLCMGFFYDWLW